MTGRIGVGSRCRFRHGATVRRAGVVGIVGRVKDSRPLHLSAGFSLLEIILALAILAGSLAALGEVMRLANQNSTRSRDESEAQIIASTVMDELVAGARELVAVNQLPVDYETDLPWVYSIAIEQSGYNELVVVRVRVEQDLNANLQPARFELVRWLPNPDYVPAGTGSQSSSSSSSSTGGTGSSSTSGSSGFGGSGGGGTR
jgi:prepilin-type N-terminal cleavage/methylation domain-containing protein